MLQLSLRSVMGGTSLAEGKSMTRSIKLMETALVCALILTGGCLLPPPVEQIVSGENRAPLIVARSLQPSPGRRLLIDDTCVSKIRFDFAVDEPDGDLIYWRVLLDHWSDPQASDQNSIVTKVDAPVDGSVLSQSFNVSSSDFSSDPNGVHTIELLVADSAFLNNGDGGPNAGRALERPDGEFDTFVWTVVLKEGEECL